MFRGSPERAAAGGHRPCCSCRLDGRARATRSALNRLEAVAATVAEAVNAAAWTISHAPAGGSIVRSIATADARDERLAGVRVGLEDEVYPLADYPATASWSSAAAARS